MGEVAQGLAKKFPGQTEAMIRKLGTEGMAAVRVYGDDVAEVVVKEGSESLDVLRKAGRPGWKFYTGEVLKHKQKLAAAGVLALFMADPDRFIDGAGRITEYAVDQFAKAGVQIASAVGGGALRGLGKLVRRVAGGDGDRPGRRTLRRDGARRPDDPADPRWS